MAVPHFGSAETPHCHGTMSDRELAAAAYERGGSRQGVSGGGFLIENALSGTFDSDSFPDGGEDTIRLKDLPEALRREGLRGSAFREVQDLLESNAEPSPSMNEMVIPNSFFVQAVEAALDVSQAGPRRSKRALRFEDAESTDIEDDDISSNDEFKPEDQFHDSNDKSDDMGDASSPATKGTSRSRLTESKSVQAQLLFRLILERLPLDSSKKLRKYEKCPIRTDISDTELHSRRICAEELRYVAQTLNENPSTSELIEMISEATRAYYETRGTKPLPSANTDAHRIGLPEYV